jgi:predicted phosphodiesterase
MRVALLSDIHGNSIALDAVLVDIARAGGADEHWVLGDIAALGPDPVGVLERLAALPGLRCTRGNTERYVCTADRPPPSLEEAAADPALMPALVEVAGTFAWTQGAVTSAGWLGWLASLPLELRTTLPDGTRFLGVHGSPGSDQAGIHSALGAAELRAMVSDSGADLICVGHTHVPMDLQIDGRHVVNLGCVGNPVAPDLRASYALLETTATGYRIELRRVDYDREAARQAVERLNHPGAAFILRHLRGEVRPWHQ